MTIIPDTLGASGGFMDPGWQPSQAFRAIIIKADPRFDRETNDRCPQLALLLLYLD